MDNDSAPLYPHVYPQAKIQKMENTENVPLTAPTLPAAPFTPTPMLVGPDNTVTVCQFCHASIKTAVKHTVTSRTHFIAALWCFICCCCCIPYCMGSTKNSDHYCPNCNKYLGTYKK